MLQQLNTNHTPRLWAIAITYGIIATTWQTLSALYFLSWYDINKKFSHFYQLNVVTSLFEATSEKCNCFIALDCCCCPQTNWTGHILFVKIIPCFTHTCNGILVWCMLCYYKPYRRVAYCRRPQHALVWQCKCLSIVEKGMIVVYYILYIRYVCKLFLPENNIILLFSYECYLEWTPFRSIKCKMIIIIYLIEISDSELNKQETFILYWLKVWVINIFYALVQACSTFSL